MYTHTHTLILTHSHTHPSPHTKSKSSNKDSEREKGDPHPPWGGEEKKEKEEGKFGGKVKLMIEETKQYRKISTFLAQSFVENVSASISPS